MTGSPQARLAVLISGNGTNLQALIDAIRAGRLPATIQVVVSNRRAAFGLERARRAGIPTAYFPLKPYRDAGRSRREYDADLAALVARHRPDWVVLAGWMHILTRAFLDRFPNRVINLHPALPGQFPGAHAIQDALEAYRRGEIRHTGVMVHLVPDERVDEGPVLATREVPIHPEDTLASLTERMHQAEHSLLVETLARLVREERSPCGSA